MATLQTKPNRQNDNPLSTLKRDENNAPNRLRGAWWKFSMGVIMAYVCYGAFFIATGNVNFGPSDNSARIVFFHVPCAILSYVAYVVGFWYGLKHLLKKEPDGNFANDRKSAAAMELGFLFCTLATITGSIFAGMVWGSFWNWDPRETSIVIMLLLYASYLVLRAALANNANQRAQLSAVYAILALVPATFLIWVVPRIMETNHPTQTLQNPANTSWQYKIVLYPSFLAFTLLFVWLFQLRSRLQELRDKRQSRYLKDETENKMRVDAMSKEQEDEKIWYAAHLLFYLEPLAKALDRTIDSISVWENIYLLEAMNSDAAYILADEIGHKEEQADIDSGHTADGKPVRWRYAGVRRLAECIDFDKVPESGREITYLDYTVRDTAALNALLAKRPCAVVIESQSADGVHPELLQP